MAMGVLLYIFRKDLIAFNQNEKINGIRPEIENIFPEAGKTAEDIVLELIVKEIEKVRNGAVSASKSRGNVV